MAGVMMVAAFVPETLAAVWHVNASFLDPGNDGFDGGDYLLFGAAITLTITFLRGLIKRLRQGRTWTQTQLDEALAWVTNEVIKRVDERTKLVQSDSNGGYSLPDNTVLTAWCVDAITCMARHLDVDLPARPDVRHYQTQPPGGSHD